MVHPVAKVTEHGERNSLSGKWELAPSPRERGMKAGSYRGSPPAGAGPQWVTPREVVRSESDGLTP